MRYTLALLFAILFASNCKADDTLYVYKKAFKETYHLNKYCPVIAGKKVLTFSLSDETDTRTKMRNAIQLADPCPICRTPNIRNTRDNRLDDVLREYLGADLNYEDEEDSVSVDMPFDDASLFDDEIVIGLPAGSKVTSSIYRVRGHRFKMLEVTRSIEDRLIGCPVTCEVINTRKSNLSGAEGILTFRPLYITAEDGTIIRLKHDDITVRGKNRTNVKTLLAWCPITWFIPGGGAKVRFEDEFIVTVDPTADTAANGLLQAEAERKANGTFVERKNTATNSNNSRSGGFSGGGNFGGGGGGFGGGGGGGFGGGGGR